MRKAKQKVDNQRVQRLMNVATADNQSIAQLVNVASCARYKSRKGLVQEKSKAMSRQSNQAQELVRDIKKEKNHAESKTKKSRQ